MTSSADENIFGEMENISKHLMKEGYTEKEIDSAFSWLINNLDELEKGQAIDFDKLLTQFTNKNWLKTGKSDLNALPAIYPLPLKELDIIGEEEIEHILEHSIKQGKYGVDICEIKAKVANLILNPGEVTNGSFFVYNPSNLGH
jgi:uncharacterized protein Smg (DUF494 family)